MTDVQEVLGICSVGQRQGSEVMGLKLLLSSKRSIKNNAVLLIVPREVLGFSWQSSLEMFPLTVSGQGKHLN